ncbi:hypothetical protein AZA_87827 [Nitrospirillum viridazoti Y2]|nr:hypothetical protein [Nitrospirillum amazonense]EGY02511.1 hypothetical protein AZA_87827 [Nitrospirillum amazonense Y2]
MFFSNIAPSTAEARRRIELRLPRRPISSALEEAYLFFYRVFKGEQEAKIAELLMRASEKSGNGSTVAMNFWTEYYGGQHLDALGATVSPPPLGGFSAYPETDASWGAVFGKGIVPSMREKENAVSSNKALRSFLNDNGEKIPQNIKEFRNYLKSNKSSVITIIGHNEGFMLKTPPKGSMSLVDMDQECLKLDKFCVFLSCRADRVGVVGPERQLTIKDAEGIAEKIKKASDIAVAQNKTKADLMAVIVSIIQEEESDQKKKYQVKFLLPPFLIASGLGMIYINYHTTDNK